MKKILLRYWPALPVGFGVGVAETYFGYSSYVSWAALAVFSIGYSTLLMYRDAKEKTR